MINNEAIKKNLDKAAENAPGTSADKKSDRPSSPKFDAKDTLAKFNPANVCQFFANNKCWFGKKCRKDQPKLCIKFKKFGLKKINKNECNEECESYHPRACFESIKSKTCKRSDCKFYHLNGTKREEVPNNGHSNGPVVLKMNLRHTARHCLSRIL